MSACLIAYVYCISVGTYVSRYQIDPPHPPFGEDLQIYDLARHSFVQNIRA